MCNWYTKNKSCVCKYMNKLSLMELIMCMPLLVQTTEARCAVYDGGMELQYKVLYCKYLIFLEKIMWVASISAR